MRKKENPSVCHHIVPAAAPAIKVRMNEGDSTVRSGRSGGIWIAVGVKYVSDE